MDKLGVLLAGAFAICTTVLLVALTVRVLMWVWP